MGSKVDIIPGRPGMHVVWAKATIWDLGFNVVHRFLTVVANQLLQLKATWNFRHPNLKLYTWTWIHQVNLVVSLGEERCVLQKIIRKAG